MNNEVKIISNGLAISGWNLVSINRSIANLADSFKVGFSDAWADQFPEIYIGLPVQIKIDEVLVITGFIDSIEPAFIAESVSFNLAGRSTTGDLVDCNKIEKPFTYRNKKLDYIAKDICKPFQIEVLIESSIGEKFKEVSVNQNESLFDFLYKLAEQRSLLLITNPEGNLIVTNAGNDHAEDTFIEGENIVEFKGRFSFANRYSKYMIKGQNKTQPKKNSWTSTSIATFATAEDEWISRYRPKMLTAKTSIDAATAKAQVNWEAQIRAGRSTRFTIVHPGWTQSDGSLWKENLLTYIKSPLARLDGEYLVESVDYELIAGGGLDKLSSSINFVNKDTYRAAPAKKITKSKKAVGSYGWIK